MSRIQRRPDVIAFTISGIALAAALILFGAGMVDALGCRPGTQVYFSHILLSLGIIAFIGLVFLFRKANR